VALELLLASCLFFSIGRVEAGMQCWSSISVEWQEMRGRLTDLEQLVLAGTKPVTWPVFQEGNKYLCCALLSGKKDLGRQYQHALKFNAGNQAEQRCGGRPFEML
jgi:hypothetical protein